MFESQSWPGTILQGDSIFYFTCTRACEPDFMYILVGGFRLHNHCMDKWMIMMPIILFYIEYIL